jgi:hypothetical protein
MRMMTSLYIHIRQVAFESSGRAEDSSPFDVLSVAEMPTSDHILPRRTVQGWNSSVTQS